MKCSKCGTEYDDSMRFCSKCGEPSPEEARFAQIPVSEAGPVVQEPLRSRIFKDKKSLVISIIAGVVILVLLSTTVVFALQWSSANERAKSAINNAERAEAELAPLKAENTKLKSDTASIETTAKETVKQMMRIAVILMSTGMPTAEFWDLLPKVSKGLGGILGGLMRARGASEEEINQVIKELTG